jgi:3-phenylpropionate/cinnamic acid dioxygenase small subunit
VTTTLELSPAVRREIVAACERLAVDYAHYADTGRTDAWAALFAADAEFHIFGQVHKGRDAIREIAGASGNASMHVISNVRIDVLSEDAAEGTAYVAAYVKAQGAQGTAPAVAPTVVGIYRDTFRRTGEGWRFATRAFEPFLMQAS